MTNPKNALYLSEQIRTCEQQAQALLHLDELELMTQAGTEAFFFIKREYPQIKRLAIFCGKGNNAGDGYVLAGLAQEHGLQVILYQCSAVEDLPSAARQAAMSAFNSGVECQSADEALDSEVELIVDALLGIGLKGPVRGIIASAINQINSSGLPVVSLDIPSGLNADTGKVENICVKAEATLTFIAPKAGLFTLDGPEYCGAIQCRPLQVEHCVTNCEPLAHLLCEDSLPIPLATRKKNAHKGNFGHVLVIGGGPGMPGAAALAAKSALRVGAGMVTVATYPDHVSALLPIVPEAMIWGIDTDQELQPLLAKATVCIIGPGLGETVWATELFLKAVTSQLPMVIDASALHLLAQYPQIDDNWILTPHPGEASRLLACPTHDIQSNRFTAAAAIQHQYGGIVVLKGAGTIIHTLEKKTFVCPKGNPGMASAGMGDVLSGIIAGLCAQGLTLSDAAKAGVWIHAQAGDKLAKNKGEIGLLATDLIDVLPDFLNAPSYSYRN